MTKFRKSVVAACLAAACVFSSVTGAAPIKSNAASASVRGGIQDYNAAQELDILTNGISGELSAKGEATLCYKYTPKKNMVVKSSLAIEGDGDVQWKFKKKVNGVFMAVESWCKEKRDGISFATTPLAKNTQYVVEVKYKTTYGDSMSFALAFEDAKDEGEKRADAKNTVVKVGGGKDGKFNYQGDHDYFSVNTGKYNGIKVTLDAGKGTYPVLEVMDKKGKRVSEVNTIYVNSSGYVYTNKTLKKHTDYVIHVYWWNGCGLKMDEGDYHLSVKGYNEVSNKARTAKKIKIGKKVKGRSEYKGDKDYYKFTATKTTTLSIKGVNVGAEAKDGQTVSVLKAGSNHRLVNRVEFGTKKKFKVEKGKTYIVVIERVGNYKGIDGTYSFIIK
ncbi:MAG: hypothetical protein E7277_06400 [Lachnospiraceae bacterium]|nr:hypothetical protein [Lachnospiraceae bacterium]